MFGDSDAQLEWAPVIPVPPRQRKDTRRWASAKDDGIERPRIHYISS